jgi:hypothetical protein
MKEVYILISHCQGIVDLELLTDDKGKADAYAISYAKEYLDLDDDEFQEYLDPKDIWELWNAAIETGNDHELLCFVSKI